MALEDSAPAVRARHRARLRAGSRALPLQHGASVSQVYASEFQDDDAAREELGAAAGTPLTEPGWCQFANGRRRSFWDKNVVAVGHAAGFLEPLAGTDTHLLVNGLFNLLDHFPDRQFDPALIASYNAALVEDLRAHS